MIFTRWPGGDGVDDENRGGDGHDWLVIIMVMIMLVMIVVVVMW